MPPKNVKTYHMGIDLQCNKHPEETIQVNTPMSFQHWGSNPFVKHLTISTWVHWCSEIIKIQTVIIKWSRLVQELSNFYWFGIPLGASCCLDGVWVWGVPQTCAYAHTHTHMNTCVYMLNMIISITHWGIPGEYLWCHHRYDQFQKIV